VRIPSGLNHGGNIDADNGGIGIKSALVGYCIHEPIYLKSIERNLTMVVRQHPRYPASFRGTLVHKNRLHQINRSLDLSCKGCRVTSSFSPFAGMKLDVLLYLPEGKDPMLIKDAIVRWSGSHGIGIEFPALSATHQQQLGRTIHRLETMASHGQAVGVR
jgi:PilZ domain